MLEATVPTALLSTFDNMNGNGAWTLFIADVAPGDLGTLEDWSVDVTGNGPLTSVPDGGATFLLLFGGCLLLLLARLGPFRTELLNR